MRAEILLSAPPAMPSGGVAPGGFLWLLAHEARLGARSFPAGKGSSFIRRYGTLMFWGGFLCLCLHLAGYAFAPSLVAVPRQPTPADLMSVSFFLAMGFAILTARSLDGVTHLLYSRADLDLLLSSPLPPQRVFSARLMATGLQTLAPALFFTAPFANMAVLRGDWRWISLYPLMLVFTVLATCLAGALATLMFSAIGAKRTRVVAQVVATVLATGIGIAAQINKLVSDDTQAWMADQLVEWSQSSAFAADSPLVWPAQALLGAWLPMLQLALTAVMAMLFTGRLVAARLAANAVTALGADMGARDRGRAKAAVRRGPVFRASPAAMLRRKEWLTALRSPWLAGELLTPLVYLLPPVVVLSKAQGGDTPPLWLMVSALTMLGSQIAAGVSRLMISGEDAPELVATAPVTRGVLDCAKIVTVVEVAAILLVPPIALVFWHSALAGFVGLSSSLLAVVCVCFVHLWFRTPGQRETFYGKTKVPITVSIADQMIGFGVASAAGFAIRANPWAMACIAAVMALMLVVWSRRVRPEAR